MPKKRWKELDARLNRLAGENQKLVVAQQKTEAGLQELRAAQQRTDSRLTGIGITIGDTSASESLFCRNAKEALARRGIIIDRVMPNVDYQDGEFDLFCVNGDHAVLVEVKARLRSSDINFFLKKQIPDFRKYFTEYKETCTRQGEKLIGALASMAVSQKLERRVEDLGLFLFTQTEEGGASIANSIDFNPTHY